MFKRGLSLLLAVGMCLSALPVSVFAVAEECVCTELCGETPNAECSLCATGEVCGFSDAEPETTDAAEETTAPTTDTVEETTEPTVEETTGPTTEPAEEHTEETTVPTTEPLCAHGNPESCVVCAVEALIAALPTVDEMLAMDNDGRNTVYTDLMAATDAYDLLAVTEQEAVANLDKLIVLHTAFGQLVTTTPEEGIAIDESTFPDSIFRNYVKNNFDKNNDSILSNDESAVVTTINVSGMEICSLQGIAYFANLEQLDCRNNKLTSLNLGNNPTLTTLLAEGNIYTVDTKRFDLSMLPAYLDVSKTSNWDGGSVSDNTLNVGLIVVDANTTIMNSRIDTVTYAYDCGNNMMVTFTFKAVLPKGGTCGDNLTWEVTDDGTLRIEGTGNMDTYYPNSNAPWHGLRHTIVKLSIGSSVSYLSVQDIAELSLDDISVDDNNKNYSSLDGILYNKSQTKLILCSTSRTAPVSGIPETVQEICDNAFRYTSVSAITLPESLKKIGNNAFFNSNDLTNITIPHSVETIGNNAFNACYNLATVTMGGSVTSIGSDAFSYCEKLSRISLPASVKSIEPGAFAACRNMQSISVAAGNANYCSKDGVLYSKDMKRLIQYPAGKTGSFTVPDGIEVIAGSSFWGCEYIDSPLSVPASVRQIGEYAFTNSSIDSFIFFGDAPTFGFWAFGNVTATVYHPTGNSTWVAAIRNEDLGGSITWNPGTETEGLYPAELKFGKTLISVEESCSVRLRIGGQGEDATAEFRFTKEGSDFVYVETRTVSANNTYYSYPNLDGEGTYHCHVTLTNPEGYTFEIKTAEPLVVGNYLALGSVSTSGYEFSLGESIRFDIHTIGKGEADKIEYVFYKRSPDYSREEIERIETTDLTLSYTPKTAGEYYVDISLTNKTGQTTSDSRSFEVMEGLWLKDFRMLSSGNDILIGDTVVFYAVTAGTGELKDVEFLFEFDGQEVLRISNGARTMCSYIPDRIGEGLCTVTITDMHGNTDSHSHYFSVKAAGESELQLVLDKETVEGWAAYSLGETVNFALQALDDTEIQSVEYRIESWRAQYESVTLPSTGVSAQFKPKYGGDYTCSAHVVFSNGNTQWLYAYFSVADSSCELERIILSHDEIDVGETLWITTDVAGTESPVKITYNVAMPDDPERWKEIHSGTETTFTYVPKIPGQYDIQAVVESKTGTITSQTQGFWAVDENSCRVIKLDASAYKIQAGDTVTFTPVLSSTAVPASFTYRVWKNNPYEATPEAVDIMGKKDFSITFEEAGSYSVEVSLVDKNSDGLYGYGRVTWAYAEIAVYDANSSVRPIDIICPERNINIGSSIEISLQTQGVGTLEFVKYLLRGRVTGEEISCTETSNKIVQIPINVADSYTLQVTALNDRGEQFDLYRGDYINARDGIYVSDIELSEPYAVVGKPITFTPKFSGEGEIVSISYRMHVTEGYGPGMDASFTEPTSYTWTPTGIGIYDWVCDVIAINDRGTVSICSKLIELKDETLVLDNVTLDKSFATASAPFTATAALSGEGGIREITFTLYLKPEGSAEEVVAETISGVSTEATFTPKTAGQYRIEATLITGRGARYTKSIDLQVGEQGAAPVVGLNPGQFLEIDGARYTADENGHIWLDGTEDRIATAHAFGTSALKDPQDITAHQQYPTSMDVWHLHYDETTGAYTLEKINVLDNLLTYRGTSIRMTGNQGIRIFTTVSEAKRAALIDGSLLKGTTLEGYKLVEYGTLFKWLSSGGDLVYDAKVTGNRSVAYGNGKDAVFSRQNGEIWYTGMLVNLKPELCDDELLLRPYAVLRNSAGDEVVIHGGTLQRNIGYVAYQNKDYKPNKAAEDFIWNIIYAVYGKDFKG